MSLNHLSQNWGQVQISCTPSPASGRRSKTKIRRTCNHERSSLRKRKQTQQGPPQRQSQQAELASSEIARRPRRGAYAQGSRAGDERRRANVENPDRSQSATTES